MNLFKLIIFSILLFVYFNSCNFDDKEKSDFSKLKMTIDEFYTAINSGNTEKRLSLFAPDAIIMPNHGELIEFNDSVKAIWKRYDDDRIFRIKDLKHVDIELSGNIAYTVNTYYYTFHRKDSKPEWHKTKNVHIWRKQKDGSWKLYIDIWNSCISR